MDTVRVCEVLDSDRLLVWKWCVLYNAEQKVHIEVLDDRVSYWVYVSRRVQHLGPK